MRVITLDGPGGVGKGTVSQMLAQALGYRLLDSGAIYRIVGWRMLEAGLSLEDLNQLPALIQRLALRFEPSEGHGPAWVFDGNEPISNQIRTPAAAEMASKIATDQEVRALLLQVQRDFASEPGLVCDGRDMGTVVFPNADLKIFLDASLPVRAKRQYKHLKEHGIDVSLRQIETELQARDARDRGRAHAPLVAADDAVVIDTSHLPVEAVFERVMQVAASHR